MDGGRAEERRRKRRKSIWRREIFGQGRIERTEKGNEESIWRRKIFGRRTLKPKNTECQIVRGQIFCC